MDGGANSASRGSVWQPFGTLGLPFVLCVSYCSGSARYFLFLKGLVQVTNGGFVECKNCKGA